MSSNKKVLIIVPTYNERENIVLIVPEILKEVPFVDILVVDDSSPDGTADCVRDMQKEISSLHLLVRKSKEGLGKAYISGFKWALDRGYDLVFEMDADFSHNPKYLKEFLKAAEESDLVIGSRYISGVNVVNWPMHRLLLSYFGNMAARLIAGIPVQDCTGGFKCFRADVLRAINLNKVGSSGYSFQVEMNYLVWQNKYTIKEIPIVFTDRQFGESKMSTKIIREALLLLWKLRFKTMFTRRN